MTRDSLFTTFSKGLCSSGLVGALVEVLGKPGTVGAAAVTLATSPRARRFRDGLSRQQDTHGHAVAVFKTKTMLENKRLRIKDWCGGDARRHTD